MQMYPLPGFFEPVNAILHLGAAAVFTVLGIRLLHANRGDRRRAMLLSVFVFTSIAMLAISGVYHMLAAGGSGRAVMFRMDKAAIFALIAGTFTPAHGLLFRGAFRWVGLVVMWLSASTGIVLVTVFFNSLPDVVTTSLYLILGWAASISMIAAWRRRGFSYVRPIVAGGVAYSVGAILLELNWPTIVPGVFGPHELWHIAVITGLGLHWRFIVKLARDESELRRPAR